MSSELPQRPAKSEAYVPELDGIRGIAIAAVMAVHFIASQVGQAQNRVEKLAENITGYGMWGVDLFFVLSGYLITGLLWDTKTSPKYFRAFYMRRTLRIFPLYYGVLLLLVFLIPRGTLALYAPEALQIREVQAWLWSYLTNVYVAKTGSFSIPYVSHFWTLAIEEHFYLMWPLLIRVTSRNAAMLSAVVLSIGALALRIGLSQTHVNELWSHVLTPCRLDSLCIGAWFALLIRGPRGADVLQRIGWWLLGGAAGLLLLKALPVSHGVALALKESVLALVFGAFVAVAAWSKGPAPLKAVLRWRALRELGKYSYGLYVFHAIVAYYQGVHHSIRTFERWVGSHTLGLFLQALVGSLLSIAIAVASYHLYEVRFLKLKKWFKA